MDLAACVSTGASVLDKLSVDVHCIIFCRGGQLWFLLDNNAHVGLILQGTPFSQVFDQLLM